ncbi:MAG: hypothetical protein ABW352_15830 [Polyangiales bacterium]
MEHSPVLKENEIIACTGARVADEGGHERYQVQFDGAWIEVEHAIYERVRQIQDSCA